MTPKRAAEICDKDPLCGGFTYKVRPSFKKKSGKKLFQGSQIENTKYDIFFFHLIVSIETDLSSWNWNFYRTSKTYITFSGKFQKSGMNKEDGWTEDSCKQDKLCLGLVLPRGRALTYVNLDILEQMDGVVTKIKTVLSKGSKIYAQNSWQVIDRCCPK